mgnify:FL=1
MEKHRKMNEDKLIAIAINTDNLDLESKQKTDEPWKKLNHKLIFSCKNGIPKVKNL